MTDLRIIGDRLRGCPECRSHEIIMFVSHRNGIESSDITCMNCGHTVRSEHMIVAARLWGTLEVHA